MFVGSGKPADPQKSPVWHLAGPTRYATLSVIGQEFSISQRPDANSCELDLERCGPDARGDGKNNSGALQAELKEGQGDETWAGGTRS